MPLEFLESKCLNYDTVTVESRDELVIGEYVALIEIDWKQLPAECAVPKTYVFSTYSKTAQVEISFTSASRSSTSFDYLSEVLKSCTRQRSQRKTYQEKGHADIFRCASITDSGVEYGFLYYQNDSRNGATLKETIVFNKLENFELVLEEGDTTTKIVKSPDSDE